MSGPRRLRTGFAAAVAAALLAAATAAPAVAGVPGAASAGATWTARDAQAPAATDVPAGWHCRQRLELPAPTAAGRRALAACRHGGGSEWHLLQVDQAAGGRAPRLAIVARLGDAAQVRLRLFVPAQPCAGAAPCIAALVLADQRDESSCHGTQVLVATGGALRSLGYIDEVRERDGHDVCVGPDAEVTASAGVVRITLPGPLLRIGRDGVPQRLPDGAIEYRIAAVKPALQRLPARR